MRGYRVYESIWAAALGKQIGCIKEPLNALHRYTVALKKDGAVIGHLPQKKYREFVYYLSEKEEQLSVLSQAQEDIHQICHKEGLRYLTKLNSYMQRKFNIEVQHTYIYL